MARPSIEQVRGIGELASVYRWNMSFAKFPSIGSYPATEELNLRCETTELPKATNTPIEVNIRGHKIKQHGVTDYSKQISLTFVDTINNVVTSFMQQWREACWQVKTGVAGTPEEVQGILLLTRLNSKDEGIWQYKMVGVFLEDYEPGGTLGGESDAIRPTCVLSFDYFEDGVA